MDDLNIVCRDESSTIHSNKGISGYDDQTEILTENGWRFFKDNQSDAKIATMGSDGTLEYQASTGSSEIPFKGQMYHFENRSVDLCVTPNHTLYASTRCGKPCRFNLITASDISIDNTLYFKKNANWTGQETNTFELPSVVKYSGMNRTAHNSDPKILKTNDWFEFFGWYTAEGSIGWNNGTPYTVVISQNPGEKAEKIKRCIERLGFNYSIYGKGVGCDLITICSKQLATYMAQFGKQSERFIPDYIKNASPDQINLFLKPYVMGDGSVRYSKKCKNPVGSTCIWTNSRQLADDITELLLKCGTSGYHSLKVKAGTEANFPGGITSQARHDIFSVSFLGVFGNEPQLNSHGGGQIVIREYIGKIYNVKVQNGLIYVRRNGKSLWSGSQ